MTRSTTRTAATESGVATKRAAANAAPKPGAVKPSADRAPKLPAAIAAPAPVDAGISESALASPALRGATPEPAPAPTRWTQQDCKLTEAEYGQLSVLKKRALRLGRTMKRSELLRVGLHVVARMSDDELRAAIESAAVVPRLRARR